jgi:hypothetical protein
VYKVVRETARAGTVEKYHLVSTRLKLPSARERRGRGLALDKQLDASLVIVGCLLRTGKTDARLVRVF